MKLEQMIDFFTARVGEYDTHMLNNVEGCKDGYVKMAELLPDDTEELLDLGCGTGLELDEIFKRNPNIRVTGIDLTKAMLHKLRKKHPTKKITLINASYFDYELGIEKYDVVISFQTMHHFSHEEKIALYTKIYRALKPNGQYIESDYMVIRQEDEDFYYRENQRRRKQQKISEGAFYHYDTPCTIDNQLSMLCEAGFDTVEMVWRQENTTIVVAEKMEDK